ncbi:MAG: beta-N-acetylhexosaminidase [Myxococcaceae bacterium]|nr:beta-N-acetylhexosaminidase [Myxococcaceae bacterium]MBH2006274.1 beta-N-acetylhexosaminidase [Myxococcaceae bacterium]
MSDLPLGRLFMFGFEGTSLPRQARDLLEKDQALGTILFKRNIDSREQLCDLNGSIPGLVSVDQEGGRVARLKGICREIPSMRELGLKAKKDPELPYKVGSEMGFELKELGFEIDFAPIMDVDTNPKNPIIGDRSFSRDPEEVARFGAGFIRGMQAAGVHACAKHFPGHGDTEVDSHLDLPVIMHERDRIERIELLPFQAAIEAKVACIMTAHILVPALDSRYPATLSSEVLTGILRQQMGYQGVIVSDDLEMHAVADRYSVRELVRLGLLAGVDLFLVCKELDKTRAAIDAAHDLVDTGQIPRERVWEALERVEKLRL